MATPIDVPGLAHAYRRLVVWFGVQLVLSMVSSGNRTPESGLGTALLSLLILAGVLTTLAALVYYGFRTAQALGSGAPWLWALAMFIPCANVLTLLALSSNATKACRDNGIPVGFLGPKV
ncbi:MAG: hypothetical protein JJE39_08770 [Vicinamibacteria bacterium]|nr:hypothetical protein [Vicinamibacteria bacterium]